MEPYTIDNSKLLSKCGWSPYDGWEVPGRVQRVTLRGRVVYDGGKVLASPGDGRVIEPLA